MTLKIKCQDKFATLVLIATSKKSYSATTFRALVQLKNRFAKEKTRTCNLALVCDDVIFEQQQRRGVTAETIWVSFSFCFFRYSQIFPFRC